MRADKGIFFLSAALTRGGYYQHDKVKRVSPSTIH